MAKFNSRTRIHEMRERKSNELVEEVDKLEKEAFDLRMKASTESLASPARFNQIRKDVARLKTILRERDLGVAIPEHKEKTHAASGAATATATAPAETKEKPKAKKAEAKPKAAKSEGKSSEKAAEKPAKKAAKSKA
jgi:large subunit ribosomal protein L29